MKIKFRKEIKIGTVRYIKRFAFLPIQIHRELYWLQTVFIQQERIRDGDYVGIWENQKFVSKDEYLKNNL